MGITSDLDINSVKEVIDIYVNGDSYERETIRNEIFISKLNLEILSFSELYSERAYNEKKIELIKNALILQSIEDFRWDPPRPRKLYLSFDYLVCIKVFKNRYENTFQECNQNIQ